MRQGFNYSNYCNKITEERKTDKFLKNINSKDIDEIIDFINEIGYGKLSEEHRWSFVNHVTQRGKANEIYEFMYKVIEPLHHFGLPEANVLAHAMVITKDAKYIEKFALDCEHIDIDSFIELANYLVLAKGNIGGLLDIVKSWSMDLIDLFTINVKNLTEHEIDEILSVPIKHKSSKNIYKVMTNVKNLTYDNIINSLKGFISDSTPPDYIDFFDLIKLRYSDALLKLKDFVIKTKNFHLIASYLFITLDIDLINKIFGDVQSFIKYLRLERNYLYISDEVINIVESKLTFGYVDDNIDEYLDEKESKLIKK